MLKIDYVFGNSNLSKKEIIKHFCVDDFGLVMERWCDFNVDNPCSLCWYSTKEVSS
ncbi:MAG: hypothetical protein ACOCRK_08940 [bacterium]